VLLGTAWGCGAIDHYGVTTLTTVVGVLIAILTVIFLVGCMLDRRVWKKPYHSETVAQYFILQIQRGFVMLKL